jgi:uncharacterized protein
MKYKLSKYLYIRQMDMIVLIYNMITHTIFALRKQDFELIKEQNFEQIQQIKPFLFSGMKKLGVIIPENLDELSIIKMRNRESIFESREYRLTINPTLDCNFHCWYCYEKHPKDKMPNEVVKAIENHVLLKLEETPIQVINIDWFGGEPLLCFDKIVYPLSKKIIEIANTKNVHTNGSMTTNGYLINQKKIEQYIEIGLTNFQITLDGNESMHDKIRFLKNGVGSFSTIIDNINRLSEFECFNVYVRINYTQETLKNINEIACLFSENAKKRITICFQQVWQDSFSQHLSAEENKVEFIKQGFNVMPPKLNAKYHVCYADKMHQVVINYDGRIFKCTARDFCGEEEDGLLLPNGKIQWNMPIFTKRLGNATFENKFCMACKYLPACFGPCSQKMLELQTEDDFHRICLKLGIQKVIESKIEEHYQKIKNNIS